MDKKISAGKKFSPGKIVAMILCILAAGYTVVLLFISGYFSGQMKAIDKYFTSVARGDLNGYKSCFLPEYSEKLTEADLEAETERLKNLIDGEEVKTDVTFVKREKQTPTLYIIYFDLTVYNDDGHVTEQTQMFLHREGIKWTILQ